MDTEDGNEFLKREDVASALAGLMALLGPDDQPNINALWRIAKDIDPISLNIKFFGYDLAKRLAAALPVRTGLTPVQTRLAWKPSTQADIQSDWVAYWAQELKVPVVFHRKLWELAFVPQALSEYGLPCSGSRGLGFGCGQEALPSLFAARGSEITVTDMAPDHQSVAGWANTAQHASTLDSSFHVSLVNRDTFDEKVSLRYVDMNNIPPDLTGYDFCWSICAFEHLGSIEKGLTFIERSMDTLKPGGASVHTTEFNFFHEHKTIDNWPTVLFLRKHFEDLAQRLTAQGHKVRPLDFNVGSDPLDRFIDIPPFIQDWPEHMRQQWGGGVDHIKIAVDGFPTTCFGVIVEKG